MSKKIILACMCVLALSSCKKDYQKLATEFERALPDTLEVLTEQINEVDHYIYYKSKNNTELIRYDLDKESKESVSPKLDKGESYNFDGKLIKQETEEDPIGDLDVPSLKYWQCVYCQTVITSSTQPNAKGTQCPKRPVDYLFGNPHVWQYIGDAQ